MDKYQLTIKAIDAANSIADFSPPAEVAKAICETRGIPPYGWVSTSGPSVEAWRAIIMENTLMVRLAADLRL